MRPHRGEQVFGAMLWVASDSDKDDASRFDVEPLGATFGTNRERGLQSPGRIRTGTVERKGWPAPIRGRSATGNVEEDDGPEGLAQPTEPIELPALTGALA